SIRPRRPRRAVLPGSPPGGPRGGGATAGEGAGPLRGRGGAAVSRSRGRSTSVEPPPLLRGKRAFRKGGFLTRPFLCPLFRSPGLPDVAAGECLSLCLGFLLVIVVNDRQVVTLSGPVALLRRTPVDAGAVQVPGQVLDTLLPHFHLLFLPRCPLLTSEDG